MKVLIIAEKPNVALKIASNGRKILGDFKLNGVLLSKDYVEKNEEKLKRYIKSKGCVENDKYIISFAEGHLVALYDASDYNPSYKNWRNIPYPFVPEPFKTKVSSDREYLFKNLEKLMNSSEVNEIWNASDGDREGETIFRLIYYKAKCSKPVKRLWVESHSEDKLLKAIQNIKSGKEYDSLWTAGYCRTKSDWLMGAVLTAKATIELGSGKSGDIISVGRVQTAVLAEICRVEELNRNFKSKKFYNILGKFKTKDGKEFVGEYTEENFDDINKVQAFINKMKREGKIAEYNVENKNTYSPPLYDQTSLAIEMSKSYNLSPDETLATSQSLYEKGYATYPRTSSRYITSSDADDFNRMMKAIVSINPLAGRYTFDKNNKRIIDDSKVESHTAIIPTSEIPDMSKLNKNEQLLYEELVRRVIAVNFPPAVDEKQCIITNVSGFPFKSTGTVELKRGWREVYDLKEKNSPLPVVKVNDIVEVISLEPKEVVTQPPKRYTEATLLSFMETCGKKIENEEMRELMKNKGIGTAATRAEIINKLKKVKYIELKGKTIYPTDKGMDVIKKFPVEELKNADFTGDMEFKLYKVEKGEMTEKQYMDILIDLYKLSCNKLDGKQIGKISSSNNNSLGKCPLCGSDVVTRKGQYGQFYSCTGYKNGCKFSLSKVANKTLTETQVKDLLTKGKTSKIKGLKKKDGKELSPARVILKPDGTTELDFS